MANAQIAVTIRGIGEVDNVPFSNGDVAAASALAITLGNAINSRGYAEIDILAGPLASAATWGISGREIMDFAILKGT